MSNGPLSPDKPKVLRRTTLMSPIRGSSNWIHAIADNNDGTVIGTRIKVANQRRAGTAVRSSSQANKIASGNPTASEPAVKSSLLTKIGSDAGFVRTVA